MRVYLHRRADLLAFALHFAPEKSVYASPTQERPPMTSATILPTANQAWGFFGSIRHHADSDQAWALAFPAIAAATGASGEGVRAFLDRRQGRHFADEVADELHAG